MKTMKKIIKLTESDLLRIIKKVIKEQESQNDKFDQCEYYFDKKGYYPNEDTEKEIYIDINTQDVFIVNNEGKIEKLPDKIPYKKDIGFDNIPKKGKIKLNPEPKEKGKIYIPIQILNLISAKPNIIKKKPNISKKVE
jgi:hypothetical protein